MEAYAHGVSTLDVEIARFRERTLTHTTLPYAFLDATYCKVATGVSIEGTREVLGTAVGDSESFDFWREFLTGRVVSRGCTW